MDKRVLLISTLLPFWTPNAKPQQTERTERNEHEQNE